MKLLRIYQVVGLFLSLGLFNGCLYFPKVFLDSKFALF